MQRKSEEMISTSSALVQPLLGTADEENQIGDRLDSRDLNTLTFDLDGLTCSACVQTLHDALKDQTDLKNVQIGLFPRPSLKVEVSQTKASIEALKSEIVSSVEDLGFECTFRAFNAGGTNSAESVRGRLIIHTSGPTVIHFDSS